MVQYIVNWDSYNDTLPMIVEVPNGIPDKTVAQWLFDEYDTYTLEFEVYDPKMIINIKKNMDITKIGKPKRRLT